MSQPIAYNSNILIVNNIIRNIDILSRDIRLRDVLTNECARQVSTSLNVNIMTINALRSKFMYLKKVNCPTQDILCITCNGVKNIHVNKITSRILYRHLINRLQEPPTSIRKWEEIHNVSLDTNKWKHAWILVKGLSESKDERDFTQKFLHRHIYTNDKLKIFGLESNDACTLCSENHVETIEHAYSSCEFNKNLVNDVILWLNEKSEANFNVSKIEYFIGICDESDDDVIFL
jgi:hypothetical protein